MSLTELDVNPKLSWDIVGSVTSLHRWSGFDLFTRMRRSCELCGQNSHGRCKRARLRETKARGGKRWVEKKTTGSRSVCYGAMHYIVSRQVRPPQLDWSRFAASIVYIASWHIRHTALLPFRLLVTHSRDSDATMRLDYLTGPTRDRNLRRAGCSWKHFAFRNSPPDRTNERTSVPTKKSRTDLPPIFRSVREPTFSKQHEGAGLAEAGYRETCLSLTILSRKKHIFNFPIYVQLLLRICFYFRGFVIYYDRRNEL